MTEVGPRSLYRKDLSLYGSIDPQSSVFAISKSSYRPYKLISIGFYKLM